MQGATSKMSDQGIHGTRIFLWHHKIRATYKMVVYLRAIVMGHQDQAHGASRTLFSLFCDGNLDLFSCSYTTRGFAVSIKIESCGVMWTAKDCCSCQSIKHSRQSCPLLKKTPQINQSSTYLLISNIYIVSKQNFLNIYSGLEGGKK